MPPPEPEPTSTPPPSSPRVIRIAVISDLHAYEHLEAHDSPPSYLRMSLSLAEVNRHPLAALHQLIDDSRRPLTADILVCPGDMGNKADPISIQYAWSQLNDLAKRLKTKTLAAVPGNHDHDSRGSRCKFDPKGFLQSMTPPFPFEATSARDCFWARNYAILHNPPYRIVVLNSSAFHGIGDEFAHGRISPYTLESLKKDLASLPITPPINILVCHHHPQKYEDLNLEDSEMMTGGDTLLKVLGSGDYGDWLVVHGHKHHTAISYASSIGSSPPVIFCAGSLCAFPSTIDERPIANQFYIIDLPYDLFKTIGFVGSFRAWDWSPGYKWQEAAAAPGLPAQGGFGLRTHVNLLASQIAKTLNSELWKWDKLLAIMPELAYLLPTGLIALYRQLSTAHGISCEGAGPDKEIGKRQ